MIRFLADVYSGARAYLNDDEVNNWTDFKLSRKAVIAFEELEAELVIAGIPIIHSITSILTIPPVTVDDDNLDMSTVTGYPTDMILPIWMKERQMNEMNRDFVDMVEVDFIPQIDLDIALHYWCWYQNTIMLRGSTEYNQVQLRYQRFLPVPGVNTDSILVPLGQLFLAPRTAALAAYSAKDRTTWADLSAEANANLARLIVMNVKELQNTPAKRRPYHRGYGRNRVLRDF